MAPPARPDCCADRREHIDETPHSDLWQTEKRCEDCDRVLASKVGDGIAAPLEANESINSLHTTRMFSSSGATLARSHARQQDAAVLLQARAGRRTMARGAAPSHSPQESG